MTVAVPFRARRRRVCAYKRSACWTPRLTGRGMEVSDFISETVNQHFVSRVEQRLNSFSENARPGNEKIYRFDVECRSPARVRLVGEAAIKRNLSFQDLFTISRIDKKRRINFESLFQRYEDEFKDRAGSLLARLKDIRSSVAEGARKIDLRGIATDEFDLLMVDLKFIYKYKLMAGLRNPYRIADSLREFRDVLDYCHHDLAVLMAYFRLEMKNQAEERRICGEYDISSKSYRQWIRLMLLMLHPDSGAMSLLDGLVDEFFAAKELTTSVLIHISDDGCALLPDTGVVKNGLDTYINVSKCCFIVIGHRHTDGPTLQTMKEAFNLSDAQAKDLMQRVGSRVFASLNINDEQFLANYNAMCVSRAFARVFSGSQFVSGVEVMPEVEVVKS